MGFTCRLHRAGQLQYRAELGDSMIEHEIDHVFVGRFDGTPTPNPLEVDAFAWIQVSELRQRIAAAPENLTFWLRLLLESRDWAAVEGVLEGITT